MSTGDIERASKYALKTCGVPWAFPVGLGELYERGTVVALDTSGVTTVADTHTGGGKCVNMAATETTAGGVYFDRALGSKLAVSSSLDHDVPDIKVRVVARRYDASGSAADDTALGLVGTAAFRGLSDSVSFALSGITKTPAGMAVNATGDSFEAFEYDLTGAMTAAQRKMLTVNHKLKFELSPSKTVGTGLALQVSSIEVKPHINLSA